MNRLDNIDVKGKTVIVRCDFNVPIKNNIITDNSRLVKSLKTINYLIKEDAKIILLSHLGRVKSEEDKVNNSLEIVALELNKLLDKSVVFISECYGQKVREIVNNTEKDKIILLQNTRYMDYPDKLESSNNLKLAEFWASLADVFVFDAFGASHRAHASTAGIAKFIPSAIGFLVQEELENLHDLIEVNKRPFTIFMGGAKIEDKLPIIKKVIDKCDYLLLGGGIANSFLKASGVDIGNSLATDDKDLLNDLTNLLSKYKEKIILPLDDFVKEKNAIMDFGDKTIANYSKYFNNSQLIFINGTIGKFEDDRFASGTKLLLDTLTNVDAKVILGGGDTINALTKFGYIGRFAFESSGGGATLEYIANGDLEVLKWL